MSMARRTIDILSLIRSNQLNRFCHYVKHSIMKRFAGLSKNNKILYYAVCANNLYFNLSYTLFGIFKTTFIDEMYMFKRKCICFLVKLMIALPHTCRPRLPA